jgi:hypothetical protein
MIGRWVPCLFVTAAILVSTTPAMAQSPLPFPTSDYEKKSQEMAAKIQAYVDDSPLNRSPETLPSRGLNVPASAPVTQLDAHVIEFRAAIPQFLDATLQLYSAVSSGQDLRKPARIINTQTDAFLKYAKWMGSRATRPGTSELEKLEPQQRSEEMLLSLNRLLLNLRQVLEDDKSPTTTVNHSATLEGFEVESLRLKWLSSHLP